MKSSTTHLYANSGLALAVTAYSEAHSSPLPRHIVDYHAHVSATHPHANYMISDFQAQAHVFLARAVGARRVLEIGVFVGYSSLVWAHAVGPGGRVTGLESSAEYAAMARDVFRTNGVDNVDIVEGDALETLSQLSPQEPYDLIFIDAQKSGYPQYLQTILSRSQPGSASSSPRLLRRGGLLIADNVLQRGTAADDSDANPWAAQKRQTPSSEYQRSNDLECIRRFNDAVRDCDRLENWLLPLYDGVNIARLLD